MTAPGGEKKKRRRRLRRPRQRADQAGRIMRFAKVDREHLASVLASTAVERDILAAKLAEAERERDGARESFVSLHKDFAALLDERARLTRELEEAKADASRHIDALHADIRKRAEKEAALREVVEAAKKLDARLRDTKSRTVQEDNCCNEYPFPWTTEDEQVVKAFQDALAALNARKEEK